MNYWLSFVLLSMLVMLVTFHGNSVLAQSSPSPHLLIPSNDSIDDDIEIIEEMINQQEKAVEPEELETNLPTTGNKDNDDNDDSSSIAALDNDNKIGNDRGIDGYSSPTDMDKDNVVTIKETHN